MRQQNHSDNIFRDIFKCLTQETDELQQFMRVTFPDSYLIYEHKIVTILSEFFN